jgi:hypothetical protein
MLDNAVRLLFVVTIANSFAFGANLVTNGSFETNSFTQSQLGVPAGSNSVPGWTIAGTDLDLYRFPSIHDPWPAQDGLYSVQLAGTPGPSSIQQDLATQVGAEYVLSLFMTGHPFIGATWKLDVMAGSEATVFSGFWLDPIPSDPQWRSFSWRFTATSPITVLKLSDTNQFFGAIIDNIQVTAVVPEPSTLALAGLGLAAAALRLRRR